MTWDTVLRALFHRQVTRTRNGKNKATVPRRVEQVSTDRLTPKLTYRWFPRISRAIMLSA